MFPRRERVRRRGPPAAWFLSETDRVEVDGAAQDLRLVRTVGTADRGMSRVPGERSGTAGPTA
jgi:hypothetical protein